MAEKEAGKKAPLNVAAAMAASAVFPLMGPSALAVSLISAAVDAAKKPQESAPQSEEARMELMEWQIRLAKEYAIARRIDTAEKVTIEEFYEAKGSGKVSAQIDPVKKSGKGEIGGGGERVTRRIYTFEGVRELSPQEISQMEAFLKHGITASPIGEEESSQWEEPQQENA